MIPLFYKDLFFCRVRKGEKKPFESEWQNKLYTYEEINKYFPAENYGVLTGINNFGALDDDTPNKELHKIYDFSFPETKQVRGHYYFFLDGWDGKKIIFEHQTNLYPDSKGKLSHHMGELQGKGQQVVGAGSLHPSGQHYEIIKDLPIARINYSDFIKVFSQFIRKENKATIITLKDTALNYKKDYGEADINNISLNQVLNFSGIKRGNQIQGANIWHGSDTGLNFSVNLSENVWFCFRCNAGGGVAKAIGLNEGIISNCGDSLDSTAFKQVLQIAKEKYGLKLPEQKQEEQPKGWALSVSITRMAERYNLTNCPECNKPFTFKDSHGLFYCKTCKYGGSIKQFAKLILNKNKVVYP